MDTKKAPTIEGRRLLFALARFRKNCRKMEPLKIPVEVVQAARKYGVNIR